MTKKICDSSSVEDLNEECDIPFDSSLSDVNFANAEEDEILESNDNPCVGDFILV